VLVKVVAHGPAEQIADIRNLISAPEPPSLLSFASALSIGAGVLYSRRLRRNRK
jgi:hypothetical protein